MGKPRKSLRRGDRLVALLLWQGSIIIGLAMVLFLIKGFQAGFSALLGGLAYWLPTSLWALRIFRYQKPSQAKQFVIAFFLGEMIKLFLSAVIFLFIVQYLPVSVLFTLIGFIGAILAFWVVGGIQLSRVEKG